MTELKNTLQVQIFVSRNEIGIKNTSSGAVISCKDSLLEASPGQPALPRRLVRVALPEGMEASKVSTKINKTIDLTDRFTHIRPMPYAIITELPDGSSISENRAATPNAESYKAAYGANAENLVRLVATEGYGSAPVAVVSVPVISMSKEGILELYAEMELTITYRKIKAKQNDISSLRTYRQMDVYDSVVNPNQVLIKQSAHRRKSDTKPVTSNNNTPGTIIPDYSCDDPPKIPTDVDYLIITDNHKWHDLKIERGESTDSGSLTMLDAFNKLAAHKKQRGYRVHVALVTNIVNGYYGNFKTGARDLTELLRNFLKDFCPRHGVEWVLLGGDIDVIPVRYAVVTGGPCQLPFGTVADDIPEGKYGHIEWKDNYLKMRVDKTRLGEIPPLFTSPDGPGTHRHELTMLNSGSLIPYDNQSSIDGSNLRWFHTTDSTFQHISQLATEWIRIEGPPQIISGEVMWYIFGNRIPTDLYYSSLRGPNYSIPGKHDWDLNSNGIYGQLDIAQNTDGIEYSTSIGLGRAPVSTADEALTFCDKVIEYEKAPERPQEKHRFSEVVYVAEHVDRNYRRIFKFEFGMSFEDDYYLPYTSNGMTTIHAKILAKGVIDTVVSYINEDNWNEIHYNVNASSDEPGWFYTDGLANDTPSVLFPESSTPLPTEYISVFTGKPSELEPMHFVLDGYSLDAAVADTNELAQQMYNDFPSIDKRICLYTDIPDLSTADGPAVPGTYRLLTTNTLNSALQNGPHFVSLNGHGSSRGCCEMNSTFVNSLTNGSMQYVVWAVSCNTASMEDSNNFARLMVSKQGGGAVAYVGFSRSSIGYPGPLCRLAFFKRLRSTRHLARLHDARLYMWSATWVHRFDILSCTLYGDPEMPVYRTHLDAQPLFIGNRRSKELHEDRCPWAKMITRKIYFNSIAEGLASGYDGCGFCLREHHTK